MWLFCKSGFFSAVKHNTKPNTIHVRARFKGDIERLCQKYDVKPNVTTTIDGDYSYRMDFADKAGRFLPLSVFTMTHDVVSAYKQVKDYVDSAEWYV